MSQPQNQDFTPPPQYSQSQTSNQTWTSVVTTKVEASGTVTQSLQIIKRGGES